MKLTKRKALQLCLELWWWIKDNPGYEKRDWPKWKEYGYMKDDCPACEYEKRQPKLFVGLEATCYSCPIWKPTSPNQCTGLTSPYTLWMLNKTPENAQLMINLINKRITELHKNNKICNKVY